jgi:hypothetical protein
MLRNFIIQVVNNVLKLESDIEQASLLSHGSTVLNCLNWDKTATELPK